MLKDMGVNGIRTSHNPPAPELLEIADRLGFIVMDEAFDMWKLEKTKFDYHLDWAEWHKRDLEDMVLRDRNHPSVVIWSIGNEVIEQWNKNPEGGTIAKELGGIVRHLDPTRPITSACNGVSRDNKVLTEGDLDLVGTNYAHRKLPEFAQMFPGRVIIGTETNSSVHMRGSYRMPSDEILRWPREDKDILARCLSLRRCFPAASSSAPKRILRCTCAAATACLPMKFCVGPGKTKTFSPSRRLTSVRRTTTRLRTGARRTKKRGSSLRTTTSFRGCTSGP